MSNITNYSFLFQSMFGGTKTSWGTGSTLPGVFLFSQLNSSSIQSQLKAAGIDTSSKQYKAVIQQMAKDGSTGSMFTNVQSIKNLGVSQYLCWYCIITSPVGSCAHPLHCANSKFAQCNSRLQTVCPSCRLRNERRWKIMHYSD